MSPLHVGFVPPRYGTEVVGGAETAVRRFAEELVVAGHRASVFTGTARDSTSWADWHAPGSTLEAGVEVHRFTQRGGRAPEFGPFSEELLRRPHTAEAAESRRFFELQGPWVPDAVDAALDSDAEVLVAYPYLFWPEVELMRRAPERTVCHPAAHDEAPLRLPELGQLLGRVAGLVFQTRAEAALLERVHRVAHVPRVHLGLGVDPCPPAADARARVGLEPEEPFLLCLGRIDPGKGTETLARFFAAYRQRRRDPLKLVLAGPPAQVPEAHPEVIVAGLIDEDVKWGLLAECLALVNPSGFEAFSFVVIEAMTAGRPVLVNSRCGATREHAVASGGGIPFASYAAFEVALDRLLSEPELADALGRAGRRYANERFRWPLIIDRYVRFLTSVTG